ncbi:MAG: cation-translocating P-type ATPase, partial [Anaerolineae bacterium]|nr:cation-translocating P-type ATPase [Anaerolineae bacterium]
AEGRAVTDNIRRFITYILASNVPEVLPFVLTALLRIPLALTVAQILAIDLGTDVAPALALGVEAPRPEVMQRPPRRRHPALIDSALVARALWLGCTEVALCYVGFFVAYRNSGVALSARTSGSPLAAIALATTVFHAGVVAAQVGSAWACRQDRPGWRGIWRGSRLLWAGIGIELALVVALIYVRPLAAVFNHTRLPLVAWAGLAVYPFVVWGVDRLRAAVVWRMRHGKEGGER